MDRVARLVVQIEEAISLGRSCDVSRLRLSLLLLDSAAELMLYRQVNNIFTYEGYHSRLLSLYEARENAGYELSPDEEKSRDELRERVVSAKDRARIERNFGAKLTFLQRRNLLEPAQVRVLRKLHKYRNDAYHNDRIRRGSLDSAVRVYTYVVCCMMRDFPLWSVAIGSYIPDDIKKYFDGSVPFPYTDVQALIANKILKDVNLDQPTEISHALSEHVLDRLTAMVESLEFIADYLSTARHGERWSRDDALRIVQIDNLSNVSSLDQVRQVRLPISPAHFKGWQHEATKLAYESDPLSAFSKFADIEDALEPIEAKIEDAAMAVDGEVQLQIDIARGK